MKRAFKRGASFAYGLRARVSKGLAVLVFLASPVVAEPVTILALGDSLTQGYGLRAEAGLVPQLEGWLRARGSDVRVINAGVSGDTTAGGRARLDWSLTDEVDAVIVALGGNDLLRGIPINTVEGNLDVILAKVRQRDLPVMLVGYRATANFGPEYQAVFNEMYPRLAKRHGAVFQPYVFEGISRAMSAGQVTRAEVFQRDGIHPNARGVVLNVAAMGPYVEALLQRVR